MRPEYHLTLADVLSSARSTKSGYQEVIRCRSLSAGLYVLPAGGHDRQAPHSEDEVYVVLRGRGRFTSKGKTVEVAPGDLLFVEAQEPHRFEEISEELVLAVVFAPPEGSRATPVRT